MTLPERPTGCTVVLVDGEGVPGGVSQRGGAPGTSETDLLNPLNMVDKVNAIVLAGGSAYGLEARTGVMRYLEEQKMGWRVSTGVVPIVPSAILFDLGFGKRPDVRPNADCGYRAVSEATSGPVAEGNVGAGAGATVGKMGEGRPMKGGLGSAAFRAAEWSRGCRAGGYQWCRRRDRSRDGQSRRRRARGGRQVAARHPEVFAKRRGRSR